MDYLTINFSNVYQEPEYDWQWEGSIWEYSELSGTDGYLDPTAELVLKERIRQEKISGRLPCIRFLDSGNYHYMSKLFLTEETEPFFLVVFDHHTDMQPPALPVLSCGSWIRDSLLECGTITGVCVIGPPASCTKEIEVPETVQFITEEDILAGTAQEKWSKVMDGWPDQESVYLSVDKDVLSKEEIDTNWDQGCLSVRLLLDMLRMLVKKRTLLAADICGEPGREEKAAKRRKSSEINRKILETLSGEDGK